MIVETVFSDARIVTPDAVIAGAVVVRDGRIVEIADASVQGGERMDGDYLLPGLIELHAGNLERYLCPRPGVSWGSLSALLAHDAQVATSGITTAFDAVGIATLCLEDDTRLAALDEMFVIARKARDSGILRADHLFHLRCEIGHPAVLARVERVIDDPHIRLVSVMDHTPGQRQFIREDKFREYYRGMLGFNDFEFDACIATLRERHEVLAPANRGGVVTMCRSRGIAMASHDDGTAEQVAEAIKDGMVVAEFPTTVEAALLSRQGGMKVEMGAPNLVRGGSHSGNVSARAVAAAGLLDIVSSDYVPFSLIESLFKIAADFDEVNLAAAVRMASWTPAETIGLDDRGAILVGRRADLVRVAVVGGQPIVRSVWREGRRVA